MEGATARVRCTELGVPDPRKPKAEFDAERLVQASTAGYRRTPREAPRGTIGGHGQAGTTPDLAADRSNKVATSACERITLARATTLWI